LLYYSRQPDQAIEQFRRTVELDPSYFWAHERLGQAYEQKRMYEAAIVEYRRAMELGGDLNVLGGSLGHAYAVSGKVPEAQAMLARIQDLSRSEYVSPYSIAVLHTGLRRNDQAFEWLERALAERAAWLRWLKIDPRLDRLRSDPRFEDLVKRSGLP
jgi:tetratricopeptide (TPR) repeat protein